MDAYKDDRYSGILGGAKWLKDKLMGMPSEVNTFYAEGKTKYLADMDAVIGKVADVVGGGLTAARARIAQGKAEIAKYVAQLPQDLQKVGKEAESKLDSQFEQLTADVDSKQSELVDTLARKYVESRDALDARIDEMKAANRGLVDKAIDAVAGVIKTIIQLKNMLLGVLAKAADVIGDIIADPIGFLGKLVDGIKAGLSRFVGNIATHLQEGLMGWLFGAIGRAGIQLPKSFDIAGIFDLVMQVLGLTYRQIRARVVKLVGEKVVARLEKTVDVFKVLVTEGVAGPVEVDQGQGRRPRRDGHGRDQDLHHREDHQGRHHVADRLPEPGRRLHQGVQDDLRRHHVHHRAWGGDHGLRPLDPGLDRRHRQGQHRHRRPEGRRLAGPRAPAGDLVPGEPARPRRHLGEDPLDHPEGPGADRQGRRLRRHGRGQGREEALRRRRQVGQGQSPAGQGTGSRTSTTPLAIASRTVRRRPKSARSNWTAAWPRWTS